MNARAIYGKWPAITIFGDCCDLPVNLSWAISRTEPALPTLLSRDATGQVMMFWGLFHVMVLYFSVYLWCFVCVHGCVFFFSTEDCARLTRAGWMDGSWSFTGGGVFGSEALLASFWVDTALMYGVIVVIPDMKIERKQSSSSINSSINSSIDSNGIMYMIVHRMDVSSALRNLLDHRRDISPRTLQPPLHHTNELMTGP